MLVELDVINLCKAIALTEQFEGSLNHNWNTINIWWKRFARDKRYKVYYGCTRNNGTGIWYIGDPDRYGQKVLVERDGNTWYARFANDANIYQKKPCYRVEWFNGGIVSEWQNEVII